MSQWDDRLREILKHATPEKRRVWEDSERRRDPSLHRQREWVRQLVELADEIDRRGLDVDWRTLDLFWIRAFGVLRELGDRYTQTVRNLGPERAGEGPLSQWGRILYGTAAEILSPLREEEVIVIDWLRHRAAHVFQRGYVRLSNAYRGKTPDGRLGLPGVRQAGPEEGAMV